MLIVLKKKRPKKFAWRRLRWTRWWIVWF